MENEFVDLIVEMNDICWEEPVLKPIEEWGGLPNFDNIEINGVPETFWTISDVIVALGLQNGST